MTFRLTRTLTTQQANLQPTQQHERQVDAADGKGVLPLRAGPVPLVAQRVKQRRLPLRQEQQALQRQQPSTPEVRPRVRPLHERLAALGAAREQGSTCSAALLKLAARPAALLPGTCMKLHLCHAPARRRLLALCKMRARKD